jgi:hypothetical protein
MSHINITDIAIVTVSAEQSPIAVCVVPRKRNETWGWGLEWSIQGEFPIVRGFFRSLADAQAEAERLRKAHIGDHVA